MRKWLLLLLLLLSVPNRMHAVVPIITSVRNASAENGQCE
jgi:hypothetical protein